jgi:U3 small nucleolar RNA-associated protein 5
LSKVKTLYKVLNQRSKALDPLLLLKGKLDMLDAQLSLRKQLVIDRGPVRNPDEGHLIYVEGEEDSDSSAEDAHAGDTSMTSPSSSRSKEKKNLHELVPDSEEQSEDNGEMPMTNGIVAESDASDYDSEENEGSPILQREGGLVDDEAEESDEDSHPSDREDNMSEEEDADDDDEEDSEMDDFIDDGPIEQAESASEISLDETTEKPPTKKHRHH